MNKKRTIIVTASMALVVIALIVVVIVVAVMKNAKKQDIQNETSSGEIAAEQIEEKDADEENPGPVSNEEDSGNVESEPVVITPNNPEPNKEVNTTNEGSEKLPKAGPLDVLPIALILGLTATYLSSKKLAKSEA